MRLYNDCFLLKRIKHLSLVVKHRLWRVISSFRQRGRRSAAKLIVFPAPELPESTSNIFTATEIMAFFAGIAIVFTLVSKLFLIPFMHIEEVVYGLTFADESISRKTIVYACAFVTLPLSILISILMRNNGEKKKFYHVNKLQLFIKNHNKISFIVLILAITPLILSFIECFSEEINFYISILYLTISCYSLVSFFECTVFGRSLIFFTLFMLIILCIVLVADFKKMHGDKPVVITLQDGAPINALRCTVSKEGFVVIKDTENKQRIIHVSKIKEITENNDELLNKSSAESYSNPSNNDGWLFRTTMVKYLTVIPPLIIGQ